MGFSAIAGHLILLVALFSAGALVAGAINNSTGDQIEARAEFGHRLREMGHADYDLHSEGYGSTQDRTYANFTNNGSQEVPLDEVTLLVDGTVFDHTDVDTFQIRGATSSNLWLPGEVLEIVTDGRGDADVTVAGPHGVTAHRRN